MTGDYLLHIKRLSIVNKKRYALNAYLFSFAESEGFKPPIPERGIPDFESSAIDHSANSPINKLYSLHLDFCGCKGNTKS